MILCGDVLEKLKGIGDESVQCCITSPPYWGLRDYGHNGQLGLEKTPEEYVAKLVVVFREVKRALRKDGTLWLNLGDSYVGGKGQSGSRGAEFQAGRAERGESINQAHQTLGGAKQTRPTDDRAMLRESNLKPKDLVGIPWRVAFALQADGWWLRSDIIWAKPNPMPESVTDRPTKSHEYIFLLTKSGKYFYDAEAIQEIATGYDGRKDTIFKGSKKGGNGDTLSRVGGERWPKKMKNLEPDGQEPNTKHKRRGDGLPDEEYPARNKRSVWSINTNSFKGAHFATFPPEIPEICIKAGTKKGDTVLDCFAGAGTTLEVAKRLGRQYIGIELNEKYVKELIAPRLENVSPLFDNAKPIYNR